MSDFNFSELIGVKADTEEPQTYEQSKASASITDFYKILDSIFENNDNFSKVLDNDKKKHFFNFQRQISIKHLKQVSFFNKNGINEVEVINCYHRIFRYQYGKKPDWLYTPREKSDKEKLKDKLKDFDKSVIIDFLNNNQMSMKDLRFRLEMYEEDTIQKLKSFQMHINGKDTIKK